MKIDNRKLTFVTLAVLVFINMGCASLKQKDKPAIDFELNKNSQGASHINRFKDLPTNSQTAVDSAIELTRRLERFTRELADLRKENQELTEQNRKYKERLAVAEPELKQAKKELSQANDLLIEMRVELNNWKQNVLGYRDEMREANKAQMAALIKILKVLGGEFKTQPSVEGK